MQHMKGGCKCFQSILRETRNRGTRQMWGGEREIIISNCDGAQMCLHSPDVSYYTRGIINNNPCLPKRGTERRNCAQNCV